LQCASVLYTEAKGASDIFAGFRCISLIKMHVWKNMRIDKSKFTVYIKDPRKLQKCSVKKKKEKRRLSSEQKAPPKKRELFPERKKKKKQINENKKGQRERSTSLETRVF